MPQSSQAIAHSPELIFDIMKSRDQTYLYKFIYVSETQQKISLRAGEHRGYVNRSDTNQPTGQHVTQPGHKTSDMTCTVIKQVLPANDPFLKKRKGKVVD